MSTTNIISLFPDNPLPPTVPVLERRRFPIVIPAYYTQADIDRRIRGEFTPVHLATVTRHAIWDIEQMTIDKLRKMPARRVA